MRSKTLRFRMMFLFCSVVGVLLAASYLAFWALLAHEIPQQLNRQLSETARPILSDITSEPAARDVERLNIPGQFFEVLDGNGTVLQRSSNLVHPIDLHGLHISPTHSVFGTGTIDNSESVRIALVPFQSAGQQRALAVAIPSLGTNRVLETLGNIALLLFPLSLLLTAAISAFYVGKSLAPINALTDHAALMAKRVTHPQGFWTPLPINLPDDELGRLAKTFNHLLQSVDSAVRQLRQFVTDASHELRTPLAVLRGETELVLSKPRESAEYRNTLSIFDDELRKLTRIVEGLFTLSMADAGQLHLQSEPLYINEVLEEACALVNSRARAKNIFIMRDLSAGMPFYGDEAFLHQLFLIFLNNAIKYSTDGKHVYVSLEEAEGSIYARFRDEGIGVSKEHLPFIFERFYRADPNHHGDSHSGGLGLAIAQAIARAHGGHIECDSQLGKGSTFTLVLPLVQVSPLRTDTQPKQKLILG
jgi:two-component system, OmpR family, sensor kinase